MWYVVLHNARKEVSCSCVQAVLLCATAAARGSDSTGSMGATSRHASWSRLRQQQQQCRSLAIAAELQRSDEGVSLMAVVALHRLT